MLYLILQLNASIVNFGVYMHQSYVSKFVIIVTIVWHEPNGVKSVTAH